MAVLMLLEVPGATLDHYERVNEIMGVHGDDDAPEGLISHAVGHDGDALVIADVWESPEDMQRFVEGSLGRAIAESGMPEARPRVLPVHNRITGRGTTPGILMIIELDDLGTDDYDRMVAGMDAHVGDAGGHPAVSHTAARTDDGGVLVVDVWESPEAFGEFAESQVGPAGAAVGLGPIEPRIIPVHNTIKGRAGQPAA
jgi:heme-degrading monooxygenase HmoA